MSTLTSCFVPRPLNNVAENNARVILSSPPDTSKLDKSKSHSLVQVRPNEGSYVPNAEVGGAIVDDDGSVGRDEIVIRLPIYVGCKWHFYFYWLAPRNERKKN